MMLNSVLFSVIHESEVLPEVFDGKGERKAVEYEAKRARL